MTGPEQARTSEYEPIGCIIADILLEINRGGKYELSYGEHDVTALIEQAESGQEVHIPLVGGIWTQSSTPENEALRLALDGGWALSFNEWLWKKGQKFDEGVPSEELRHSDTGRLVHPAFVAALTSTGTAVELSRRQDDSRGLVVVNNVWQLWRSSRVQGFLPMAMVDIVDADISEIARLVEPVFRNGPWHLHVSQPVAVGREVIILPGLELPQPPGNIQ